eukprot:4769331-Pyramimonas_sp.AAC.1
MDVRDSEASSYSKTTRILLKLLLELGPAPIGILVDLAGNPSRAAFSSDRILRQLRPALIESYYSWVQL